LPFAARAQETTQASPVESVETIAALAEVVLALKPGLRVSEPRPPEQPSERVQTVRTRRLTGPLAAGR
jgi:hypothetical protein